LGAAPQQASHDDARENQPRSLGDHHALIALAEQRLTTGKISATWDADHGRHWLIDARFSTDTTRHGIGDGFIRLRNLLLKLRAAIAERCDLLFVFPYQSPVERGIRRMLCTSFGVQPLLGQLPPLLGDALELIRQLFAAASEGVELGPCLNGSRSLGRRGGYGHACLVIP
jgi:hypothetical protein